MRILFVEDDVMLTQAVVRILQTEDYEVDTARDGAAGLELGLSGAYDVIILDGMLPRLDGLVVAQRLREANITTPILMLTARAQISDKIEGLDAGADDYMTKPFSPKELLAHLRALIRRGSGQVALNELSFGSVSVDPESHDLEYDGKSINMSFKEFRIMEMLIRAQGGVISKSDIIAKIWGPKAEIAENNVEAYISILRKKLRFIEAPVSLETLRKVGYRLVIE